MQAIALVALAGLAAQAPQPAGLDRCALAEPAWRWILPAELAEISGLAALPDGAILAHDDEHGLLYRLTLEDRTVRPIALSGAPAEDYEGVAVVGGRAWLLTSRGVLYGADLSGPPPHRVTVEPTGLGDRCEFEGLAADGDGILLLACKTLRRRTEGAGLLLFRWDPARQRLAVPDRIAIPSGLLHRATGWRAFAASSVEVDPRSGHLLLLSSRQGAIVELTAEGAVLAVRPLSRKLHRQPEGLTFTAHGDLLISDEAAGKRPTLTRYRCSS